MPSHLAPRGLPDAPFKRRAGAVVVYRASRAFHPARALEELRPASGICVLASANVPHHLPGALRHARGRGHGRAAASGRRPARSSVDHPRTTRSRLDTFALRETTAYGEAQHTIAAEFRGVAVTEATCVRRGNSAGSVLIAPELGSSFDRLVIAQAHRAALLQWGFAVERCARDWDLACGIATLATASNADADALLKRASAVAYDFVRREDVEFAAQWLARELLGRKTMNGLQIGEAIAAARAAYQGAAWSAGNRRFGPDGELTPNEDAWQRTQRKARMADLQVPSTMSAPKPTRARKATPSARPDVAAFARQCEILGKQMAAKKRRMAAHNPEHKVGAR